MEARPAARTAPRGSAGGGEGRTLGFQAQPQASVVSAPVK